MLCHSQQSLLLADGESLVLQVVPASLVPQSVRMMRNRFSGVLEKRIVALRFTRDTHGLSTDAYAAYVEGILEKFDTTRRERGVCIVAPETLKSLMLKCVELHPNNRPAGDSDVVAKDRAWRALCKIMRMWRAHGVLLLDEVDVLLHPLKSELNFPIGDKQPLHFAPFRWDFPLDLLEFIRQATTAATTDVEQASVSAASSNGLDTDAGLLAELTGIIRDGVAESTVQTHPHLILLSKAFYKTRMEPVVARWVVAYLWQQPAVASSFVATDSSSGPAGVPTRVPAELRAAVQAYVRDTASEAQSSAVVAAASRVCMQHLNLARQWVTLSLIHVLSKINRVSYGLLSSDDLARLVASSGAVPTSRKLLAVPFDAKDVPSRASEFAHPEVGPRDGVAV